MLDALAFQMRGSRAGLDKGSRDHLNSKTRLGDCMKDLSQIKMKTNLKLSRNKEQQSKQCCTSGRGGLALL